MIVGPEGNNPLPPGVGWGYQGYSRIYRGIVTSFTTVNYSRETTSYGIFVQFPVDNNGDVVMYSYYNSTNTGPVCNKITVPMLPFDPFCFLQPPLVDYLGQITLGSQTISSFLQTDKVTGETDNWWATTDECIPVREKFSYGAIVTYYNATDPSPEDFRLPEACLDHDIVIQRGSQTSLPPLSRTNPTFLGLFSSLLNEIEPQQFKH